MIDSEGIKHSTLDEVQHIYGALPDAKELLYDWYGANTFLFKLINGLRGSTYDAFMAYVTQLGDHHFFLPYLAILGGYAVLTAIWRKLRGRVAKQYLIMWIGAFIVLGASAFANLIVVDGLKDYFHYPRPYVLFSGSEINVLEAAVAEERLQSFPSGHVAFITMMIFGIWPMLSGHMRLFGLFIIALVAWSRVAVGVHFPADTLWSFFISAGVVMCVRYVIYLLSRKIFRLNLGES